MLSFEGWVSQPLGKAKTCTLRTKEGREVGHREETWVVQPSLELSQKSGVVAERQTRGPPRTAPCQPKAFQGEGI